MVVWLVVGVGLVSRESVSVVVRDVNRVCMIDFGLVGI